MHNEHLSTPNPKIVRCAIYTRKSTDENLDLDFNTLDAQRVACSAYIASQRHERWIELSERYDDGGFSGGSLERPALQRLLSDVREKKVDVVAVYKVDRLTRSLVDFAKIITVLESGGASFVSITQAFSSTTSMGRLTLNVLLSFAQFERELASERVRDKIAASKAKGLWVGGTLPLGYDSVDRKLVTNYEEAAIVKMIFEKYMQAGSGREVVRELALNGVRGKLRKRSERATLGNFISLGALYAILRNKLYVGEISYRGNTYKGVHEQIIERELFDEVSAKLERSRFEHKARAKATERSLLIGLIKDKYDRQMTSSHTQRDSRRYRYYCSQGQAGSLERETCRINAREVERVVLSEVKLGLDDLLRNAASKEALSTDELHILRQRVSRRKEDLRDPALPAFRENLRGLIERIAIADGELTVTLNSSTMVRAIDGLDNVVRSIPIRTLRRRKTLRINIPPAEVKRPASKSLVELITQAFSVRRLLESGSQIQEIALRCEWHEDYVVDLMRVSFLSPSVISAMMNGVQPEGLTRSKLMHMSALPLRWARQREVLGL